MEVVSRIPTCVLRNCFPLQPSGEGIGYGCVALHWVVNARDHSSLFELGRDRVLQIGVLVEGQGEGIRRLTQFIGCRVLLNCLS